MSSSDRHRFLSDRQWERLETLFPAAAGLGRPPADARLMVDAIIYRYRAGIPWRDLPREQFGPWQTVWKRHRRYVADGTWDRVLTRVLAEADAEGRIDWSLSIDSTISRAHQHATNTTRPEQDTGGAGESQESAA